MQLNKQRLATAAKHNFFDAKTMAELYSTHGLHPMDCLPKIKAAGLKVDWLGLEFELQSICGMNTQQAKAVVAETRLFAKDLNIQG